jgi:thiol-disulfide isomerase/thioredoxin
MKSISILILTLAMGLPALSAQSGAPGMGSDSNLKAMPTVKLMDLDGKKIDSDSLKGNIVLLDFWATWCGPCIVEIPEYNALQKKYADKGVKVLGVTLASGEIDEVRPFVGRFKIQYPVLMGSDDQAYDLNISGYPTTFLITRDWKVYMMYIGGGPEKIKRLQSDLERLVAEGAR